MYCILKPCLRANLKLLSKLTLKHLLAAFALVLLLDLFGAFTHLFERRYDDKSFSWPYEGDLHEFLDALRHKNKPRVAPINQYNYSYVSDASDKCVGTSELRVVFLVKSALENLERRETIRSCWGYERRFSDVELRVVFLLGVHKGDDRMKARINEESVKYGDVVQADFQDDYYNNTIKTMMGFKWATRYCAGAKFYMFVDDDMYVSVKNVLRFVRNPVLYPDYLKDSLKFADLKHLKGRLKRAAADTNAPSSPTKNSTYQTSSPLASPLNLTERSIQKRQVFDFELPDNIRLFAGYVFVSAPHRHKTSKWYVSLKEYPYHLWPPYVTAGAYILSREALIDMYHASMYTKHFRFDDVYLGMVAKKADIEPLHCEEFHFYKKDYNKFSYKYVISSHGYGDAGELLRVWNEQKALGNA